VKRKLDKKGGLVKLGRILKRSIEHLKVNKWLSVATIVVIMLTLTVSGIILYIVLGVKHTVDEFTSRPRIYVYFLPSTPEDEILVLKSELEKISTAKSVEYVSQEEAMEYLKSQYNMSSDTKITSMKSLLPLRLDIQPYSLSQVEELVASVSISLEDNPYIDEIRFSSDAIKNLEAISKILTINGALLLFLSAFTTFLLVYVSVHFSVKYYMDEIEIMDFLGGEKGFLKYPFVFEAIFCGILGGVWAGINIVVFKYGNTYLLQNDSNLKDFMLLNNLSTLTDSASVINIIKESLVFFAGTIGVGVILSYISSLISVTTNIKNMRK